MSNVTATIAAIATTTMTPVSNVTVATIAAIVTSPETTQQSTFIGILIYMLGSLFYGIGPNIQKLAINLIWRKNDRIKLKEMSAMAKSTGAKKSQPESKPLLPEQKQKDSEPPPTVPEATTADSPKQEAIVEISEDSPPDVVPPISSRGLKTQDIASCDPSYCCSRDFACGLPSPDDPHVTNVPEAKDYAKDCLYVTGLTMYLSAGILWAIALGFAPLAVVAPFLSVAVIADFFAAHYLVGEPLTKGIYISCVFIIIGIVLAGIYGPDLIPTLRDGDDCKDAAYNYDLLVYSPLISWISFGYFCIVLGSIAVMCLFMYYVIPKNMCANPVNSLPFTYGGVAGVFGGVTTTCIALLVNGITVLTASPGCAGYIFEQWNFYIILLLVIVFELGQIAFMSKGLVLYPGMFMVTVEIILNQTTASLGALLVFEEYLYFTDGRVSDGILWGIGLLLSIVGCVVFVVLDEVRPIVVDLEVLQKQESTSTHTQALFHPIRARTQISLNTTNFHMYGTNSGKKSQNSRVVVTKRTIRSGAEGDIHV